MFVHQQSNTNRLVYVRTSAGDPKKFGDTDKMTASERKDQKEKRCNKITAYIAQLFCPKILPPHESNAMG